MTKNRQLWSHTVPHSGHDVVRVVDVYTCHDDDGHEYTVAEDEHYRTVLTPGQSVPDFLDAHYGPRPSAECLADGTICRHEWVRGEL